MIYVVNNVTKVTISPEVDPKKCNYEYSKGRMYIIEDNGKIYNYSTSHGIYDDHDEEVIRKWGIYIFPEGSTIESSFYDLPEVIKEFHLKTITKGMEIREESKELYLQGPSKCKWFSGDSKWLCNFKIYNSNITKRILEEVNSISYIRLSEEIIGNHKEECFQCILDDEYLVTVWEEYDANVPTHLNYEIKSYVKNKAKKNFYGYMVYALAKEVDVPWDIASLVGNIKNYKKALKTLKSLKEYKRYAFNLDNENIHNKLADDSIEKRRQGIRRCIGFNLLRKLNCHSEKTTELMINWLLRYD